MPKTVCDHAKELGLKLDNISRWFWILENGWIMCALFTEHKNNENHFKTETDTHYTGQCVMDVEFYFIETILVEKYICFDN